jgi:plasmid maintenance system antidote protein VapI
MTYAASPAGNWAVMKMHNPPHPGELIRKLYPKPLDLAITAAAEGLAVTRKALSELVTARTDI